MAKPAKQRDATLTPEERVVDEDIARLSMSKEDVTVGLGLRLAQAVALGLPKKLGYGTFPKYVSDRHRIAIRTAVRYLAAGRFILSLPTDSLKTRATKVGWVKLQNLHRLLRAQPHQDAEKWIGRAETMNLRTLEDEVAAVIAGDSKDRKTGAILAYTLRLRRADADEFRRLLHLGMQAEGLDSREAVIMKLLNDSEPAWLAAAADEVT